MQFLEVSSCCYQTGLLDRESKFQSECQLKEKDPLHFESTSSLDGKIFLGYDTCSDTSSINGDNYPSQGGAQHHHPPPRLRDVTAIESSLENWTEQIKILLLQCRSQLRWPLRTTGVYSVQ